MTFLHPAATVVCPDSQFDDESVGRIHDHVRGCSHAARGLRSRPAFDGFFASLAPARREEAAQAAPTGIATPMGRIRWAMPLRHRITA